MAELDANLTFVQGPSLFIPIAQALNPLGLQFDRSSRNSRNSTPRNAVGLSQLAVVHDHFNTYRLGCCRRKRRRSWTRRTCRADRSRRRPKSCAPMRRSTVEAAEKFSAFARVNRRMTAMRDRIETSTETWRDAQASTAACVPQTRKLARRRRAHFAASKWKAQMVVEWRAAATAVPPRPATTAPIERRSDETPKRTCRWASRRAYKGICRTVNVGGRNPYEVER